MVQNSVRERNIGFEAIISSSVSSASIFPAKRDVTYRGAQVQINRRMRRFGGQQRRGT